MNILLLEDDIALQNSIKLFLESKGFHIDTFYDGEHALEAIDKQPIACICSTSTFPA